MMIKALTDPPLLAADALNKRFGSVVALKSVSFDLRAGEIHALCGENGAGKSTLIKLLSGIHPAGTYEGQVRVDGAAAAFHSTRDAEAAGIAVIYQELALVPEMTVAENIFLGNEPRRWWGMAVDSLRANREAGALLKKFGLDIRPDARVADLGIGQRQLVEIAKALAKRSRVLILDEPTAALTEREVDVLLSILVDLKSRGMGLIYISHKLGEVFAVADRITVLRDGTSVASLKTAETNRDEVIRYMVGRKIEDLFPRRATHAGAPLLTVRNLSVASSGGAMGREGATLLHDLSFTVHAGEVVGIGGLMGAGRTELLMHLFGAFGHRVAGDVSLGAIDLGPRHRPQDSVRAGLVLVSEDRKRYGLVLDRPIGFNLSLSSLGPITKYSLLGKFGKVDEGAEAARSRAIFNDLGVRARGLGVGVGTLSGGNQQKVVIGKALLTDPQVILLDEPTRGIDVGAKVEIYELINALTAAGKAVVLVSSELPELMGMSDRILMLAGGRIAGQFNREEATQEALLAAAMDVGATPECCKLC